MISRHVNSFSRDHREATLPVYVRGSAIIDRAAIINVIKTIKQFLLNMHQQEFYVFVEGRTDFEIVNRGVFISWLKRNVIHTRTSCANGLTER